MMRGLAACLVVACSVWAQAQGQPAEPLLRRDLEAVRNARYAGERTVEFRRGLETKVHSELVFKDGPRYRIEYPPGSPLAGQVVIEDGRRRYVVRPGEDAIEEGPARGDDA
ncbi:MAG: hypothetical protein WHU10_09825, partial [Fimbriimonadales bacterium]